MEPELGDIIIAALDCLYNNKLLAVGSLLVTPELEALAERVNYKQVLRNRFVLAKEEAENIRKELIRNQALNKLTAEEIVVLGLLDNKTC